MINGQEMGRISLEHVLFPPSIVFLFWVSGLRAEPPDNFVKVHKGTTAKGGVRGWNPASISSTSYKSHVASSAQRGFFLSLFFVYFLLHKIAPWANYNISLDFHLTSFLFLLLISEASNRSYVWYEVSLICLQVLLWYQAELLVSQKVPAQVMEMTNSNEVNMFNILLPFNTQVFQKRNIYVYQY